MSKNLDHIHVTSHVGRDLLQSAALFRTAEKVVWEYVVNSLQYVEPRIRPKVEVRVNTKKSYIQVTDNGRGMSAEDLNKSFFTMHGENIDRASGRPGRGKFGTGKSAAFGIARSLTVDTTKDGRRNVVRLTRAAIEEAADGSRFPVEWLVQDEPSESSPGTIIRIEDLFSPRVRAQGIIEYVERHLQAFRGRDPLVAVNAHVCEIREPEIAETEEYRPSASEAAVLGDIVLTICVTKSPLPEAEQGIRVTSGEGNLVAIERGGIETKEFGNYLFGEIDVPNIELVDSEIAAYDSSRNLELNPQHPVVGVLLGFIGSHLEMVRAKLVRRSREARKDEQARRLQQEATRIAEVLNEDFRRVRKRLQEIRSHVSRGAGAEADFGGAESGGDDLDSWVRGKQERGDLESPTGAGGRSDSQGREAPDIPARGQRNDAGTRSVDPVGGSESKRPRPSGGFQVDYMELGPDEDRSRYDAQRLAILINLDHPVLKAALGDGSNIEDPAFKKLSYEIAFSEYACALGYEIAEQDPYIDPNDLLYEVRSTLNRISASAVRLYRH